MKRRHEKGIGLIIVVIVICIILMYALKNDSYDTGKVDSSSGNSNILEKDISFTDVSENSLYESEQEDLCVLFDQLQFEREDNPVKTMAICVILILYVVFIGPVLYFLLKKNDKMEWMWGILPCAAVFWAAFIMLIGDSTSIKEPVVDALTVITPEQNDVVYLAATSPGRESYSFVFDDMVDVVTPLYIAGEYKMVNNTLVTEEQDYTIDQEEGSITLNLQPREAFSQDYFRLSLDHDHEGRIEDVLTVEDGVLVGTLTNQTEWNFSDVVLFYRDSYCVLSDLDCNKSIEIYAVDWKKAKELDYWSGPGRDCISGEEDNSHIIDFAYFKYFAYDAWENEYGIAAVIADHEVGISNVSENMVSHGLYYQMGETE